MNPQSLQELQQAFPKGLRGKTKDMVILERNVKTVRYWHSDVLRVGNDEVVVYNQWGDNFGAFVDHVNNNLAPNLQNFEIRKA